MKLKSLLLATAAGLISSVLVAQGQVPGVNSTLQSIFTLAYDNSTMMPTYSAAAGPFNMAASATDVCLMYGVAGKTIKIRRIAVGGISGAVISEPVSILKRSTAHSGGTATQLIPAPYDSGSPASLVLAENFTVNITSLGTLQAEISDIFQPFAPTTTVNSPTIYTFGQLGSPLVLRGIAQSAVVNMNQATFAGSLTCTFEWTEQTP